MECAALSPTALNLYNAGVMLLGMLPAILAGLGTVGIVGGQIDRRRGAYTEYARKFRHAGALVLGWGAFALTALASLTLLEQLFCPLT